MDKELEKLELWKGHRDTINKLISEKILQKTDKVKSIVIFGAGLCDDIDLKFFTVNFEKITLIDKDAQSISIGINKWDLSDEQKNKINIIGGIDFVEGKKQLLINFEKLLKQKATTKKIVELLRQYAANLISNDLEIPELEVHDVAVAMGVHSQLSIELIEILSEYYSVYTPKEVKKIYNECTYYIDIAACNFNGTLIKYSKDVIFALYDLIEISKERDTAKYLVKIMDILKRNEIKELAPLLQNNATSGAIHGYNDILRRIPKNNFFSMYKDNVAQNFWMWTFSRKKGYLVCAVTLFKEIL